MKKIIISVICIVLIFGCFYFNKNYSERQYYIFTYTSLHKEIGHKKIDSLEKTLSKLGFENHIINRNLGNIHIALNKHEFSQLLNDNNFNKKDFAYYSFGVYNLKTKKLQKKEEKTDIPSPSQEMLL